VAAMDPDRDHFFVFRSWNEHNGLSQEALLRSVKITTRRQLLFQLTPLLKSADRVVFHSFTIGISLFYWLFAIRKIKSAWLALYGSELYWDKYAILTPWNRLQELMRRSIFARIGHIITIIDQDFLLFQSKYAPQVRQAHAFVPIPGNLDALEFKPVTQKSISKLTILLGNSATPTNHHKEIMELLSLLPFRDHLKIVCPLSYGETNYAEEVEFFGKELFQDNFVALREYLPAEQYTEILYSVDLAIMNHDRQQALGNIFTLLCIGKKVYIRGDNPATGFFEARKITIGKIEEISDRLEKADFILSEKEARENHQIMKKLLSKEHYQEMWLPILNVND